MSKKVQCQKNIHIRAVAAQIQIISQSNIFWGLYPSFREDISIYIFIHSWHFTKMQSKKDIYNRAVQQNTTRMQITQPRIAFKQILSQFKEYS